MKSPIKLYKTKLKFLDLGYKGYPKFLDHRDKEIWFSDIGLEDFLHGVFNGRFEFEVDPETHKLITEVLLFHVNPYLAPVTNLGIIEEYADKPLGYHEFEHDDLLKQDLVEELTYIPDDS